MSVQRFLANRDVVYELFDHLSLYPYPLASFDAAQLRMGDDSKITRRTLASAAVTCRAFSTPASEVRWSVVHVGLLPLLQTFSSLTQCKRDNEIRKDPYNMSYKEIYYVSLST